MAGPMADRAVPAPAVATADAGVRVRPYARLLGALLGALIALPLGLVMSSLVAWDPGRSVNLAHAVAVMAPPAAAIAAYVIAPRVIAHPVGSVLWMVLVTWAAAILLWPFASVVMPFWTNELSCVAIDSRCTSTLGMSAQQVIDAGTADLLGWYRALPIAPIVTFNQVPAMLVGATVWVVALRRWLGLSWSEAMRPA